MGRSLLRSLRAATVLFALACSDYERSACIPGLQIACPCLHGGQGVQRCASNGTFGRCVCDSDDDATPDASTSSEARDAEPGRGEDAEAHTDAGRTRAAGAGGGAADPAAGAGGTGTSSMSSPQTSAGSPGVPSTTGAVATMLSTGPGRLVAAFPSTPGIVVVLLNRVLLLSREGSELARWEDPRMITAATMDGDWLAVVDGAVLTGFDVSSGLKLVSSTTLVEACSDVVMVSGQRLVCGPTSDTSRSYATYDLKTGSVVGNSKPYLFKGYTMRRVPGADRIVTVTNGNYDFYLFVVGEDNQVLYLGETPPYQDVTATTIFAFDADPARHLITQRGLMLDFGSPECLTKTWSEYNSIGNTCFVKDGALGTLTDGQSIDAMTSFGGTVYALVNRGLTPAPNSSTHSYLLQSISVAQRTVVTQAGYRLDGSISGIAFDPISARVLLSAVELTNTSTPLTFQYRVMLLPLE